MEQSDLEYDGHAGRIVGRRWAGDRADYIALLVHGYGEHCGRYDHVARRLVADGAVVYAIDHVGHGRSAGERYWSTTSSRSRRTSTSSRRWPAASTRACRSCSSGTPWGG